MRFITKIDFSIVFISLLLSLSGIFLLKSFLPENRLFLVKRQILWLILSLSAMVVFTLIDYRKLVKISGLLYGGFLFALIFLLIKGAKIAGTASWIKLGSFSFQPSEIGKVITALFLARLFSESPNFPLSLRELIKAFVVTGVPIVLILFQPDMGTAFIYISLLLTLFALKGVKKIHFQVLLLIGILLAITGWFFLLKDYQKTRIISFINPSSQPRGAGYQVYQSRIAIGSGGIFGKGYGMATQAKRRFLPAAHTDFIFSVFAEQFGFTGVFFLLLLYLYLFIRMLRISALSYDNRGVMLGCLLTGWMAFQTFMNVIICLGMFPVAGFPLPFLSYGGSSLLSSFICVGIINSILVWR